MPNRFQASAAERRASRGKLLAGCLIETDFEYAGMSGAVDDGGCGMLDFGASGWIEGRPVRASATLSDD